MKKIITVLSAIILMANMLLPWQASAQTPQKMNYQAVIRNSSNILVTSTPVGMRVSILRGSATGNVVYQEIYNPNPQTNANGLVNIEIGSGIALTGLFDTINWATGTYFIKTETDPTGGTSYSITGTSQLLSVPYALNAAKTDSANNAILLGGEPKGFFTSHVLQAYSPGCNISCPTLTTGSTNAVTINSVSITVPGPGKIFVSFNGEVEAYGSGTGFLYVVAQICNSATGTPSSVNDGGIIARAIVPSGYTDYPMSSSVTFTVATAGTYTYYYRAAYFSGTSLACTFYSGNMSAIYTHN